MVSVLLFIIWFWLFNDDEADSFITCLAFICFAWSL